MSNININDKSSTILHSKKIQASYGVTSIVTHLIDMVLVGILFFFYEAEIGLQSWLTALGLIVYAVWDAFNDPLVGYITDRPFKFTKKWGRRFPWMIISYIPWLISFLFLFTPPNVDNQWIIFGWLTATLCIYDFFESVFTVNFLALFPDKFRDSSERISASAFVVYIGFGGIVGSILIPPLLITYGDVGSYMFMAGVCIVISFICGIFMIPGLKDDKDKVERYLTKYEMEGGKKESFFKILKQTLKHKSFVIFLTMYILYLSLTHLMNGSIIYFVRYVLKGEASMIALISLALMIGGLISIPFWIKLNKKLGDNRKTMIIGGIIMVCFASLLSLFTELTLILLVTFLFGFGLGGYWVMVEPIFGQIIDESVVNTEQRREGAYNGIRVFFTRAAVAIQAITLALVHELTGFVEGTESQSSLAVLGIRLHIGLIPAIFMAIGLLVFWKFFDLTPEKAIKLKEDIIKLKL